MIEPTTLVVIRVVNNYNKHKKNASKEKLKPSNEIARKNIFHQKHSRKHNSSNNTNTYQNNTKN